MKFQEDDGCKRTFPAGGPPEVVMKKSKTGGGEQVSDKEEDLELVMKTDSEISNIIARTKKHLQLLADKLPDKGEKMKTNLRRYEDELERRNNLQSNKNNSTSSFPDRVAEDKPSDGGVDAQVKEVVDSEPVMEIREPIVKLAKNLQTFGDKLPDNGDRIKAAPCRKEDEFDQRNKLHVNKNYSPPSSPDRLAGNKPESDSGVATNALTVDATKHDSLTDEKMQKIVNELVNIGISETDVGKAAEICYNDLVKVKVLFALPNHLRRFYVWGFLRN